MRALARLSVLVGLASCGGSDGPVCLDLTAETDSTPTIGCVADFEALASRPLDATIPGARSVKTIVDRVDENALYFQNSVLYETHYQYASTHLSGNGLPVVPMLAEFNTTEYFTPSRRFLLGALTHYEQPDKWVYEISPYDTADAEMIATAYDAIKGATFIGADLYFHPTSEAVSAIAEALPATVKVITTDQLYEGITFQPLNVAESYGQLRFFTADELSGGAKYLSFRDIAVLDHVPNDISVAMGIVTAEFQTPLSHVNVLSKNRGTPNMALRGAFDSADFRALEGKWVRLKVDLFDYELVEVSQAEADAWWEEHRPTAIQVPGMDLSATDLRDDVNLVVVDASTTLKDAVKASTRAYGGKAAHFGALTLVDGVPKPRGFAIPLYYYRQFMEQNGFDARVTAMIADPAFTNDPAVRDAQLTQLRADIEAAPIDAAFIQLLTTKLNTDYPGTRMRFRSSTNAEDLDGFTGAGLYTSLSGQVGDTGDPIEDAIRGVWASVWNFKAFEERSYRGIDHLAVGMALLCHRAFPDEEANGVALTNNPYDTSGLNPALYINVQLGGESVVLPPAGVTTDQILVFWEQQGQPVVFLKRSNLTAPDTNVLTNAQLFSLASALDKIHDYFRVAYGATPGAWYAMDVEFKFEGAPGETPQLYIKQARPHGQE
ncbi:MAG TPA: PEP/pyruvate-binding domain-containing protein [Kofleriaceae bacterium]|nr:PEP/pyruvate-binding domain-containing protein [Kofleriaceae bacterium]